MTATVPTHSQQGQPASDHLAPLSEIEALMARAQDRLGTRSGAYDLLDIARALDALLPALRDEIRNQYAEAPIERREELAHLARAAEDAERFGRAATSIVPCADLPDTNSLIMHVDEWRLTVARLAAAMWERRHGLANAPTRRCEPCTQRQAS